MTCETFTPAQSEGPQQRMSIWWMTIPRFFALCPVVSNETRPCRISQLDA